MAISLGEQVKYWLRRWSALLILCQNLTRRLQAHRLVGNRKSVSLKCLSGEDKGMEARFATTSVGGKRSMHALALKVADQADKNPDKLVAVVKLLSDHYPHKTYGKIYTPVFDVVEWIGMDGADEVAEPPPSADTGRRRRS